MVTVACGFKIIPVCNKGSKVLLELFLFHWQLSIWDRNALKIILRYLLFIPFFFQKIYISIYLSIKDINQPIFSFASMMKFIREEQEIERMIFWLTVNEVNTIVPPKTWKHYKNDGSPASGQRSLRRKHKRWTWAKFSFASLSSALVASQLVTLKRVTCMTCILRWMDLLLTGRKHS